ncbi:MAG: CsbD family protein [Candidatus Acidiferrales bacterium]
MRHGAQDEAKGTFHALKGAVKQKAGRALNKPGLEAEGQVEKIGGKLQKKLGQVERALRK